MGVLLATNARNAKEVMKVINVMPIGGFLGAMNA
jgi:hypothetical protein